MKYKNTSIHPNLEGENKRVIDTLYRQYMEKVNNKAYLSDGRTIHTFVEYDGKFIAMTGYTKEEHEIPECNFGYLVGMTIN